MVEELAVMFTVGVLVTFTVNVRWALEHPLLLPVTVYIVVEAGESVLVFPVPEGSHV